MSQQAYRPFGKKILKETTGAWLNPNRPQVILCQGARGAGKSMLDEMAAEQLYLQGWTILDLLAARNAENLFWAINKNHREEWKHKVIRDPSLKGMPHCQCNRSYPITLLIPEYMEFDRKKLDEFNQVYLTKAEYVRMCAEKKWIPEWDPNKRPRRDELDKNWQPKMRLRLLPAPTTTGSNKQLIEEIFMKAVVEARRERRIVCMNPMFYPNEYHKYRTMEIIIRCLGRMMYTHFRPLTEQEVGKPRFDSQGKPQWTKFQRNHHRVAVVMREFGEVTAAVLKGENQSTMAKKALLDYIRQTRHYNISLIGDYQRPDDVFSGIRDQADIFIIKRSPRKLLGDAWKWMFDDIESRREKIIFKYGLQRGTEIADNVVPKIQELGNNYAYVIYINDKYKLWKIPTPNFHHKDREDHFEVVTGLTWVEKAHGKINLKEVAKSAEKNSEDALKDSWEAKMYEVIRGMVRPLAPKKSKKWSVVFEEVAEMVGNGVLEMPNSWSTPDAMRKWFSRKEKKMLAPLK